jgi:uncharacterized paraquat-inducible protein A
MSDTTPCPYCQADIYEDAVQCPRCGNYISAEDAPSGRKPVWMIVAAVICLVLIGLWMGLGRLL